MIGNICIQIAATEEWQAFLEIEKVQIDQCQEYPYGNYVKLQVEEWDCIFYYVGATKTRAAGACQYAIDHWNPRKIIVLGTAGGVGNELEDLDLVMASKTVQYDCIEAMGAKPDIFYEILTVEIDNSWIELKTLPFLHVGIIATGDQDIGYSKAIELHEHGVLAADWESGAIAHICTLNKVPVCIIRGVSDVPNSDSPEDILLQGIRFRENTPKIMEILLKRVLPVLLTMEKD